MLKGFKEFIMRGNVMDLAIGVVIGAAFGKIVTSFVNDILMPPLGFLIGKVDFKNLYWVLTGGTYKSLELARADKDAVVVAYGLFLNNLIDFLIVAFAIYLTIVQLNKFVNKPAPIEVTTKDCPMCATVIPLAAKRCPHCTSQIVTDLR